MYEVMFLGRVCFIHDEEHIDMAIYHLKGFDLKAGISNHLAYICFQSSIKDTHYIILDSLQDE